MISDTTYSLAVSSRVKMLLYMEGALPYDHDCSTVYLYTFAHFVQQNSGIPHRKFPRIARNVLFHLTYFQISTSSESISRIVHGKQGVRVQVVR